MIENPRHRPESSKERLGLELFRDRVRFRRPFDGIPHVIDPAEQDAVALKFNSAIDNTLLKHIEDVKSTGFSDDAFLVVDLDADNKIAVTVSRGEGASTMIHVQHEVGDMGKEDFHYTANEKGTVVRTDCRKEPLVAESFEEFRAKPWSEIEEYCHNIKENACLEKRMAYNKQPIGIDEMQGVIDLINDAEPRTDLNF